MDDVDVDDDNDDNDDDDSNRATPQVVVSPTMIQSPSKKKKSDFTEYY